MWSWDCKAKIGQGDDHVQIFIKTNNEQWRSYEEDHKKFLYLQNCYSSWSSYWRPETFGLTSYVNIQPGIGSVHMWSTEATPLLSPPMTLGGMLRTVYDPSEFRGRTCRWIRSSTNLMPNTKSRRSEKSQENLNYAQNLLLICISPKIQTIVYYKWSLRLWSNF